MNAEESPIPANYVPGDPYYARRVRWFTLAVVFAAGALFFWIWYNIGGLAELAQSDPRSAAARIYAFGQQIVWLIWAAAAVLAGWLLYTAIRIVKHGRYPAPGAKVMKATRIREGGQAYGMAFVALLVSIAALAGGAVAGLMILAAISNIPPPG